MLLYGKNTFVAVVTFNALHQVFYTNIIVYCQQNWYVRLAIYTDLFTFSSFEVSLNGKQSCPQKQLSFNLVISYCVEQLFS